MELNGLLKYSYPLTKLGGSYSLFNLRYLRKKHQLLYKYSRRKLFPAIKTVKPSLRDEKSLVWWFMPVSFNLQIWVISHWNLCFYDYILYNRLFMSFIILSGVRLSPFGTAATTGLLYQPQMIDDGDCGAIGVRRIGMETRSSWRKPAPAPIFRPQISHEQTRTRTRPPL
jgi:hypothetical protein